MLFFYSITLAELGLLDAGTMVFTDPDVLLRFSDDFMSAIKSLVPGAKLSQLMRSSVRAIDAAYSSWKRLGTAIQVDLGKYLDSY